MEMLADVSGVSSASPDFHAKIHGLDESLGSIDSPSDQLRQVSHLTFARSEPSDCTPVPSNTVIWASALKLGIR